MAIFFQHRQTEPASSGITDAVTDDRARCRGNHDGDDAELTGSAGEKCGADQNGFTRKWHTCTFERDDAENDPGAIGWDQVD